LRAPSVVDSSEAVVASGTKNESLGRKISVGAAWMLALRLSVKALGLISSIVLARLLMPEDFGIVALAMAVYALVRLIREFGFGAALIQRQDASRDHYDTAWTFQFLFSTIGCCALLLVTPFAVSYYDDPRLQSVLYALTLMLFLTGLENIGVVNFDKNMTFNKTFNLNIIPKVGSVIATIGLAFILRSYWALIIGMLINKVMTLVLGYVMQEYRPRFRLVAWKDLFGFSSYLMLNNIIAYLNRHGQNILLAKLGGAPLVGLVNVATDFANLSAQEVIQPINAAAYPGYAMVAHNGKKLAKTFDRIIRTIITIVIPSATGIAVLAPLFVPVLLGEKWLEAIPLIPYIAASSVLWAMMRSSDMIFMALSRQHFTTMIVLVKMFVFFPALYFLTVREGAVGAAKAVLLSNLFAYPINFFALRSCLGSDAPRLLSIFLRPAICSIAMYYAVKIYIDTLGVMNLSLMGMLALGVAASIGVVVFALLSIILWKIAGSPDGLERTLVTTAKAKILKFLDNRRGPRKT